MRVSGLLLAAGQGRRLGGVPKARLALKGRTLLVHGTERMLPYVDELIVAVGPDELDASRQDLAAAGFGPSVRLIVGGATRQETLTSLLDAAKGEWVLLHEVARPFTPPGAFAAVIRAAGEAGAAVLCTKIPVRDSVGLIDDCLLVGTLPRSKVVSLQTPQAYRRADLARVHERAQDEKWTEDGTAALALRAGLSVQLVEGTTENLKITYPEDWDRALGLEGL